MPASDAASPQPDASPDASSLINSCGAYYEINPDGIPPKDRAFCLENTTNHQAGNCCISDKQCSDLGLKCCPWGTDCTGPDTSCECYQP